MLFDFRKKLGVKNDSFSVCYFHFFPFMNPYLLVMKPRNQAGRSPLLTMSGTWVSMNHFDVSSLSLTSVPSALGSPVVSFCSILVRSWSKTHRHPLKTTSIYSPMFAVWQHFNSLICLFSRRRQPAWKQLNVLIALNESHWLLEKSGYTCLCKASF